MFALVTGLIGVGSAPARAQPPGQTPRSALHHYLELSREGRFAEAARYLELDGGEPAAGPELARHLKAVLDRHVWFDLERVSAEVHGNAEDDVDPDIEEVGKVPTVAGATDPVRLHRGGDGVWRFAATTVARIDAWYQALAGRWIMEHLPAWMMRPGPYDILIWQWIVLPGLVLAAWFVGMLLGRITRSVLQRLVSKTQSTWDDHLLDRLAGPLKWLWAVALVRAAVPLLGLYAPAAASVGALLRALLFLFFFWGLFRLIDTGGRAITASRWAVQMSASRSLVPLGMRVAKAVVAVIAVISLLSELGYPVASLIAGLGIGGIALALAAQKTVENLFGAFSIGVDQPFREGDGVKIDDVIGTVEAIGLRSTRIRTPDRTLISMPNGRLADAKVENFAPRDRIRLATTIGLVYDTSAVQMKQVLDGLAEVLRNHPRIVPDTIVVRFKGFGAHSLDIEVDTCFGTTDFAEFRILREEVLLAFMAVVEQAGSALALPTRTIYVTDGPPRRSAAADGRASAPAPAPEEEAAEDPRAAVRADGDDPEPPLPPRPEPAP